MFSPHETIDNPHLLHLIFCQIVRDCFSSNCIRLTKEEKTRLQSKLEGSGITADNVLTTSAKIQLQKTIVEMARDMPTYFCRLYPVSGGRNLPNVHFLGVSHSGVRLIQRERDAICDYLKVVDRLRYGIDRNCLPETHVSPATASMTFRNSLFRANARFKYCCAAAVGSVCSRIRYFT